MDKLITEKAELKVLITYVKENDWPGENLASRVHETLTEKDHEDEFLLIIGTWKFPTRWAGLPLP